MGGFWNSKILRRGKIVKVNAVGMGGSENYVPSPGSGYVFIFYYPVSNSNEASRFFDWPTITAFCV
jgi:hypothetical protein